MGQIRKRPTASNIPLVVAALDHVTPRSLEDVRPALWAVRNWVNVKARYSSNDDPRPPNPTIRNDGNGDFVEPSPRSISHATSRGVFVC